jgi:hypothetical protein
VTRGARLRRLALPLALLCLVAAARADGVMIPARGVPAPARTPDQRALVAFDGATETLVVETTVQGEGSEYAWIVPLPAAPKIEASTSGLFPTLEVLTAPRIVDGAKGDPGWLLPVVLGVVCMATWLATRRFRGAAAAGFGALLVAPIVLVSTITCAGKGAEVAATASPRELSRQTVGAFDVAVVDPGDGTGLRGWLDERGFAPSHAIDAVATDYARRGWVFVAAKLKLDAPGGDVRRVHPLAFTFPTKEAVHPMRLTLAANPTCALELFACGAGTAAAAGLNVEASRPPFDGAHEELTRRTQRLPITKLVGTLAAATTSSFAGRRSARSSRRSTRRVRRQRARTPPRRGRRSWVWSPRRSRSAHGGVVRRRSRSSYGWAFTP